MLRWTLPRLRNCLHSAKSKCQPYHCVGPSTSSLCFCFLHLRRIAKVVVSFMAWPCLDATSSSFVVARAKAVLFESADSSLSNSFARAGDVFLTECQTRVVDGFSMVEVDCGALESQFVRLCSSADMLNRSDMPVFDIDSPVVRSAFRANKHRQGWSLRNHFLFPQRAFLKKPYFPTPLLPSMSVSPPEKPLSWVSSLADQHQPVLSNSVSLEPLTQSFLNDLGLVPVENSTSTHCWWAAAAGCIGISGLEVMLLAVDSAQRRLGVPLEEAFDLLSPATSTIQTEMLVTALADNFHNGLLVLHESCKGAFLFRSNMWGQSRSDLVTCRSLAGKRPASAASKAVSNTRPQPGPNRSVFERPRFGKMVWHLSCGMHWGQHAFQHDLLRSESRVAICPFWCCLSYAIESGNLARSGAVVCLPCTVLSLSSLFPRFDLRLCVCRDHCLPRRTQEVSRSQHFAYPSVWFASFIPAGRHNLHRLIIRYLSLRPQHPHLDIGHSAFSCFKPLLSLWFSSGCCGPTHPRSGAVVCLPCTSFVFVIAIPSTWSAPLCLQGSSSATPHPRSVAVSALCVPFCLVCFF